MANKFDILFINLGNRQQTYRQLGNELCGIEPPVFAGLFTTYAHNNGV